MLRAKLRLERLESRQLLHSAPLFGPPGEEEFLLSSEVCNCGFCGACTPLVESHGDHDDEDGEPHLDYLPEIYTEGEPEGSEGGGPVAALDNIPILHSNAGASASIYLDFDGHFESNWGSYSNVTTPAFDRDGDTSSFSQSEIDQMIEIWERVAEDYAPFDIDVTTEDPGDFSNGVALRISIGGNGSWYGSAGGVAYINTFTNSIVNTVYVFSSNLYNARTVAEASSHEAGHGFGLHHQSSYDANGNKTAEYNQGNSAWAPIMGVGYYSTVTTWHDGPNSYGSTSYQDDMALISRTANGFGYRADDHGGSAQDATALAVSGTSGAGSGIIEQNNDTDWFSFSTGAGSITLDVDVRQVGANLDVVLELLDEQGNLVASADPSNSLDATITANVSAGDYNLVVRSTGVYGYVGTYTVDATLQEEVAPTDLGSVEFAIINGQEVTGSERWYQVTASRSGVFTFIATFDHNAGDVDLELYDSGNNLIDSSSSTADYERVETYATQGEVLLIKVTGPNSDVDLRIANLVTALGDTVEIFGTVGNDQITVEAGSWHHLDVNGVEYDFDGAVFDTVRVHGQNGTDVVRVTGAATDDAATLRVGELDLAGSGYDIFADTAETIVVTGGGGNDSVTYYDSSGVDYLLANNSYSRMTGTGFFNQAEGFADVTAHSTAGGADVAWLYDTAADDRFDGHATYSILQGGGRSSYVAGFTFVTAYATAGGNALANLFDSGFNDRFIGRSNLGMMQTPGNYNIARGFERVNAFASGGNDDAYMSDSAGDDRFYGRPTYSVLFGTGFYNYANGFDRVFASSTTGNDTAYLYDSPGDDRFYGMPTHGLMTGTGHYNRAEGFDRVFAYAGSGGADTAYLYDSSGDDLFHGYHDHAFLRGDNFYNYAGSFGRVFGLATAGGNDSAYLFDSTGDDRLYVNPNDTVLRGAGFYNQASGFDTVAAQASTGDDRAVYSDVGAAHTFYGRDNYATHSGAGFSVTGYDFDRVTAESASGETATADVENVDYFFEQLGSWT